MLSMIQMKGLDHNTHVTVLAKFSYRRWSEYGTAADGCRRRRMSGLHNYESGTPQCRSDVECIVIWTVAMTRASLNIDKWQAYGPPSKG